MTGNIRTLEGALIRVVAHHSLTQRPIDLALATEVMDAMYPPRGSGRPSIDDVKRAVAAHFELSVDELVSPSRTARIAWPRQVAIHLARELCGASLQAIGEAFGGRNHATVLHACKRVSDRLSNDQQAVDDIADDQGSAARQRKPTATVDRLACRLRARTYPLRARDRALLHSFYSPYDF